MSCFSAKFFSKTIFFLAAALILLCLRCPSSFAGFFLMGNGSSWAASTGGSVMCQGGSGGYDTSLDMGTDIVLGYSSASALSFSVSPSSGTCAGAAFATQPLVLVLDQYGNTVHNAVNTVTLAIANDGAGSGSTLGGTLSKAAVAGSADFTGQGVYVSRAASGYTLSASADGLASDISASFSSQSPLSLVYPAGGEVLNVSTPYDITWTTCGVLATGTNTVEYSLNNGSSWTTLTTNGTSPVSWVTPATPSTQALVRVSNSADATFTTLSSSVFNVLAGFDVIVPDGAEVWAAGYAHDIIWTTTGSVANVRLEYSADGGGSWSTITASTANTGRYTWTPDAAWRGTNYLVRVSDASNSLSVAVSSAAFTVAGAAVTAPSAGQRIQAGTDASVTWVSAGVSNVLVEYSTDASVWTTLSASVPAASGSYTWSVPAGMTSDTSVYVRVSGLENDTDGQTVSAVSGAFAVYGVLSLAVPDGGEAWGAGSAHTVSWSTTAGAVANVRLEYSFDNFVADVHEISASLPNTGTYSWTPFVTGTTCKLRVSDAQDALAYDTSTGYFAVNGVGVTAPSAGSVLDSGSTQTIAWNHQGVFNFVDLAYSLDGGTAWVPIASSRPNTGTYSWTLPLTPSDTVLVRVNNSADALTTGQSAVFAIRAVPDLTAPDGGDFLSVGSASDITWTMTGSVAAVKLEYSINNGADWIQITASTPNDGSYSWTVPDAVSAQCLVRVSDADAGHPPSSAWSAAVFTIRPALTVTLPDAQSDWAVNEPHTITWNNTGTVSHVRLYYASSADGYTAWTEITSGAVANTGSYAWIVPDILLAAGVNPQTAPVLPVRIRVTDATAGHPAAEALSAAFDVLYYTITFDVRDSQLGVVLSSLGVEDTSGWSQTGLASGVNAVHNYPYGTYTTVWSKNDYLDSPYVGWTADASKTLHVTMTLSALSAHEPHVFSSFTYDAVADEFTINAWMEKSGVIITSPSSCTVTMYDAAGAVVNISGLAEPRLISSSADANGVFRQVWDVSNINRNTSYFGKVEIVHQGVTYSSNVTYAISVPAVSTVAQVDGLTLQIAALDGKVDGVQSTADGIASGVNGLQDSSDDIAQDIAALQSSVNAVAGDVADVLVSVGADLYSRVGLLQTDVTGVKARTDTIDWNDIDALDLSLDGVASAVTLLVTEVGTGNIAAIKAKTDTIAWADVTGIKAKTDTIAWADITGIKGMTDTIDWNDIDALGLSLDGVASAVTVLGNEVGTGNIAAIKAKTDTIAWADITAVMSALDYLTARLDSLYSNVDDLAALFGTAMDPSSLVGRLSVIDQGVNGLLDKWGTYQASDMMRELAGTRELLGAPTDSCGLLNVFGQINCVANQMQDNAALLVMAGRTYDTLRGLADSLAAQGKTEAAYETTRDSALLLAEIRKTLDEWLSKTAKSRSGQALQMLSDAAGELEKASLSGLDIKTSADAFVQEPLTLESVRDQLVRLKESTKKTRREIVRNLPVVSTNMEFK